MTPGLWVSVLVAACTILSGLAIAYMHRKQMQHNELFRLDPSIGVQPPPHWFWTFLKERIFHIALAWNVAYGIYLLVLGFKSTRAGNTGDRVAYSSGIDFNNYRHCSWCDDVGQPLDRRPAGHGR